MLHLMENQFNNVGLLAKSLTAIGKLFRITLFVSILAPASVFAQASAGDSLTGPFVPGENYIRTLANFFNWHGGLLDKEDKKLYQQALMIMLDQASVGQTMEWHSQINPGVEGQMRVVYGYQTTNGYCRVYQSEINMPGKSNSFQEYACRSEDKPRWAFYNK